MSSYLVKGFHWNRVHIFTMRVGIAGKGFQGQRSKGNVTCVQMCEWYNDGYNDGGSHFEGVALRLSCLKLRHCRNRTVPLQRSKENVRKSRGGEETRGGEATRTSKTGTDGCVTTHASSGDDDNQHPVSWDRDTCPSGYRKWNVEKPPNNIDFRNRVSEF